VSLLVLGPTLAVLVLALEYGLRPRSAVHIIAALVAVVACVWITSVASLFVDFAHCIG